MALSIDKEMTKKQVEEIVSFLKNWFEVKFPKSFATLGLSGGKDSTICAALLAKAIGPERVIGVMMPNGEQKDINDSKTVCTLLGIKGIEININGMYTDLTSKVEDCGFGEEIKSLYSTNTPARLRMVTLYGIAAQVGGFVINTCNASEDYIGYSTKYGDAAGDISLLNKLTVSEVLAIGDYLELPESLVHKTPADGMCGKSDEDNLGFTYDDVDAVILNRFEDHKVESDIFEKILKMHDNPNTKYKCIQMPDPFPK